MFKPDALSISLVCLFLPSNTWPCHWAPWLPVTLPLSTHCVLDLQLAHQTRCWHSPCLQLTGGATDMKWTNCSMLRTASHMKHREGNEFPSTLLETMRKNYVLISEKNPRAKTKKISWKQMVRVFFCFWRLIYSTFCVYDYFVSRKVCIPWMCSSWGGQKRSPESLKLELQIVVRGSRVLGVESRSYAGVASALNGWPISLTPRWCVLGRSWWGRGSISVCKWRQETLC